MIGVGFLLGGSWIFLLTCSASLGKQLRRHSGLQGEPGFVGSTVKNVTVPEGRDVLLSCTVKNLEGHKVAWIHYDRSAILTVQNHVITRNPRIGVSHEGHRTWNLHIRNVERSDQGAYMCQINTAKAKTKLGYLTVVVPPRIEDSMSSGDKVRTEGSNVTLECTARGSPKPTVTWKREDGRNINIDKSRNFSVPFVEGDILRLYKVSRLDMGAYMCIAANGVPPAVSKRIHLGIDFPPMMWVPNQQIRSPLGGAIKLKCVVEAHPEALIFWEKDGSMLQSNERIKMRVIHGEPRYKLEMKLLISSVLKEDFGTFKCIAKNPRGVTDGAIRLTEIYGSSSNDVDEDNNPWRKKHEGKDDPIQKQNYQLTNEFGSINGGELFNKQKLLLTMDPPIHPEFPFLALIIVIIYFRECLFPLLFKWIICYTLSRKSSGQFLYPTLYVSLNLFLSPLFCCTCSFLYILHNCKHILIIIFTQTYVTSLPLLYLATFPSKRRPEGKGTISVEGSCVFGIFGKQIKN
ncbi:limbic system-associated membrane protein isoform X2 [Lepeophtheirus salmonis]|uniref:limbic system-associated membrane protein isoform X2 n=1 Tax=Lepeophtheirus salmonis TaxID=72036 RepID=UPI001AE1AEE5|nr:limbic system-associated membrane protein-like isoform X2 [Lepeophtheirus salmonis]